MAGIKINRGIFRKKIL